MTPFDWRPIKTAPTFTAVLIAGGNVRYPITASRNQNRTRGPWRWELDAQGACLDLEAFDVLRPTLWAPLPDVPKEAGR